MKSQSIREALTFDDVLLLLSDPFPKDRFELRLFPLEPEPERPLKLLFAMVFQRYFRLLRVERHFEYVLQLNCY